MKRGRRLDTFLLFAAGVLAPTVVWADSGTALMFTEAGHMLLGNLFIGIGEGLIVAFIFKTPKLRSMLWMIAANYFSAWVGLVVLDMVGAPWRPDIYSVRAFLVWATIASFVVTIVLEWPFAWAILKGRRNRVRIALVASIIVQCASYAVIVPWYAYVSDLTLYTKTHVERTLDFVKNRNAIVYYIVPGGGELARVRLDGSRPETIMAIDSTADEARLFTRKAGDGLMSDLLIGRRKYERTTTTETDILIPGFAPTAAVADYEYSGEPFPLGYYNDAGELRTEAQRRWTFETYDGFQAPLVGNPKEAGERIRLTMEAPFLRWRASNATVLPGDEVVYQLDDQIVVLDTPTMRIGLVAKGSGPVVVLDEAKTDPPQTNKP